MQKIFLYSPQTEVNANFPSCIVFIIPVSPHNLSFVTAPLSVLQEAVTPKIRKSTLHAPLSAAPQPSLFFRPFLSANFALAGAY